MSNGNTYSKSKIMLTIIKGKIASIIGWPLTIFWVLGIIVSLTSSENTSDRASGVIISIIFVIINGLLILAGRKIKHSVKRFRKYMDIIITGNETNIDNIAGIISKPVNFVMTDLQKMIKQKYFVDAYINNDTHEIILKKRKDNDAINKAQSDTQGKEAMVVECKCCGANNSVARHSVVECEFCGSPVAGE